MMADMSISEINRRMSSSSEDFIKECEKAYDDRLEQVCEDVIASLKGHGLVMLAGPSSSG